MRRLGISLLTSRFLALLALAAMASCAPSVSSEKNLQRSAAKIRVEAGMSASLLRQALSLEAPATGGSGFEAIVVPGPVDFELVVGDNSILLSASGGAGPYESSFMFADDRLTAATIYPQAGSLSLNEAIGKAKAITQSLDELNIISQRGFSVAKGPDAGIPAMADWGLAKRAVESEPLIAEVGVYSAENANTAISLSLLNPSRLRKLVATQQKGEITDEWSLRLQIVARAK